LLRMPKDLVYAGLSSLPLLSNANNLELDINRGLMETLKDMFSKFKSMYEVHLCLV
jgi:hypothetical protein